MSNFLGVSWRYVAFGGPATSGHRIARQTPKPTDILDSGAEPLVQGRWHHAAPAKWPANPQLHTPGYVFGFWRIDAHDPKATASVRFDLSPVVDESFSVDTAPPIAATAHYFWDYGEGRGDNVLDIDMLGGNDPKEQTKEQLDHYGYLPDDFVDVTPDPSGVLTQHGNNGEIDTTTEISIGASITVAARDGVGDWVFAFWLDMGASFFENDSHRPIQIGSPDPHDLVVSYNDRLRAIAVYAKENEPLPTVNHPRTPARQRLYNPNWRLEANPAAHRLGPKSVATKIKQAIKK